MLLHAKGRAFIRDVTEVAPDVLEARWGYEIFNRVAHRGFIYIDAVELIKEGWYSNQEVFAGSTVLDDNQILIVRFTKDGRFIERRVEQTP